MLEGEFGFKWAKLLLSRWGQGKDLGELLLTVAAAPAQLGFYVARYVFPSYAISLRLACSMKKKEKKKNKIKNKNWKETEAGRERATSRGVVQSRGGDCIH